MKMETSLFETGEERLLSAPVVIEFKTGGQNSYPRHFHDGYELYLLLDGDVNFYIDQHCYLPAPGSLFFIRPGAYHRVLCNQNISHYLRITINFRPEFVKAISSKSTDLSLCFQDSYTKEGPLQLTPFEVSRFYELSRQLDQALRHRCFGDDLLLRAYSTELLLFSIRLNRDAPSDSPRHPLVSQMMEYIHAHIPGECTVTEMAQDLFHNRSYLSKLFREETGVSLQDYILSCRLTIARHALLSGLSSSEACQKAGFHNYHHFIRIFTRKTGVSPSSYRKQQSPPL